MNANKVVLVLDLDGTIIDQKVSDKLYTHAYCETLDKLKKNGINIPQELQTPSYDNFRRMAVERKDFLPIYTEVLKKVVKMYENEIRREELRARSILGKLIEKYNPKDIYVLTANQEAPYIVGIILPSIPKEKVITINGVNYEEKEEILRKIKRNSEKVIYVANLEIDEKIAKNAEVEFFDVKNLERDLYGV